MSSKMELIFQKKNIGLGKRKEAVARVFLIPGEGNLIINKTPGEKYLQYNETYLNTIRLPLEKLNLEKQFNVVALVKGGGLTGQAQAIQLGVIWFKKSKKSSTILKTLSIKFSKKNNICQNLIYIRHGQSIRQFYVMENHFV